MLLGPGSTESNSPRVGRIRSMGMKNLRCTSPACLFDWDTLIEKTEYKRGQRSRWQYPLPHMVLSHNVEVTDPRYHENKYYFSLF